MSGWVPGSMTESTVTPSSAAPKDQLSAADPARPDLPVLNRDARVLLAWMSEPQARLTLLGGRPHAVLTAEQEASIASARSALAARPGGIDQNDLIRPMPADMRDYIARLEDNPQSQSYFAEGYTPALVDLTRVCAFQPNVFTDHTAERLAGVDTADLHSMAGITLPLAESPVLTPQYDHHRLTFITDLANDNLQVVGAFGGPDANAPPGTISLGFQVRVIASFVQVTSIQGRYFLRDGYHRCLGLVQHGVRYAPAFVRDDIALADLVPPGMLPFETFMGDKPPVLPDYWDDSVSHAVQLPAARKVIVVQASEISIAG